jgi:hypothetical protein
VLGQSRSFNEVTFNKTTLASVNATLMKIQELSASIVYGIDDASAHIAVVTDRSGKTAFGKVIIVNDDHWEQDEMTEEDYFRLKRKLEFEFRELMHRLDFAYDKFRFEHEGETYVKTIPREMQWPH